MWPAVIAAAVAASTGFLAKKHLFKPTPIRSLKKMKSGGRSGGVCLKNNSAAPKCGSSSSVSKGTSSLFNWGLNIGIMCMMTAGKAEINKLNTTMDETAKVVQELKSELHKRKASQSQQVSGSVTEASTQYPSPSSKRIQTAITKSSVENCQPNYMRATSFQVSDYGECASSVLTEEQEPEPEVMDMDQLEAELDSELQKLPCCSAEAPHQEGFGFSARISPLKYQLKTLMRDMLLMPSSSMEYCQPNWTRNYAMRSLNSRKTKLGSWNLNCSQLN